MIKTSFGERHPDELARLKAAAGANVTVIDRTTAHEETLSLMAAADAYVSLHAARAWASPWPKRCSSAARSSRPGIRGTSTSWTRNSLLVDCELVTLDRDIPPYEAGMRWAEPDIAHAARLMRRCSTIRMRRAPSGCAAGPIWRRAQLRRDRAGGASACERSRRPGRHGVRRRRALAVRPRNSAA